MLSIYVSGRLLKQELFSDCAICEYNKEGNIVFRSEEQRVIYVLEVSSSGLWSRPHMVPRIQRRPMHCISQQTHNSQSGKVLFSIVILEA